MAPGLRLKVYLVILGFAAAGIGLFWLGMAALLLLIRDLSSGADIIAFSPRHLVPLPLSISFLALAALPFSQKRQANAGRRQRATPVKRAIEPSSVLFAIAVFGVLTTIAILPVSRLVVASIVTGRGYQPCPPAKERDRYAPYRWAASVQVCP